MTNDEVNRYIHVEIMGNCGTKVSPDEQGRCGQCGKRSRYNHEPPDYCSDASPRSLLNEVVAKLPTDLHEEFEQCLLDELGGLDYLEAWVAYSVATAKMVARACVEAHKSKEQK